MGFAKQQQIEEEQQGFYNPSNKYVCADHFQDTVLKKYITENTKEGQYHQYSCNYCRKTNGVIKLNILIEFIYGKLNKVYGDPDNEGAGYDSSIWEEEGDELIFNHDYGYILPKNRDIYDSSELFEEIGLSVDNDTLYNDIVQCFDGKLWCLIDPYGMTKEEELSFLWEHFCNLVKHRCRYTFFKLPDFGRKTLSENGLSDILTEIGDIVNSTNLIRTLPAETKIYRVRNHEKSEKVDSFDRLASPPIDKTKYPNRMSPAGISMFYGANDEDTAKKEAQTGGVDDLNKSFTIAEFKLKQEIKVVDFTDFPHNTSFWGEDNLEVLGFLRSFAKEISKPYTRDEELHIEYVPTQC